MGGWTTEPRRKPGLARTPVHSSYEGTYTTWGVFVAIDSIVFYATLWVYNHPKWARWSSDPDESVTVPISFFVSLFNLFPVALYTQRLQAQNDSLSGWESTQGVYCIN